MAKLSALEVIVGLAPQATIDTLIENQVNLEMIEEAIQQTSYLTRLAEAPFASKIQIKLIGMVDPNDQLDVHYQTQNSEAKKEALGYWVKINQALVHDLDANYRSNPHLAELRAQVTHEIAALGGL